MCDYYIYTRLEYTEEGGSGSVQWYVICDCEMSIRDEIGGRGAFLYNLTINNIYLNITNKCLFRFCIYGMENWKNTDPMRPTNDYEWEIDRERESENAIGGKTIHIIPVNVTHWLNFISNISSSFYSTINSKTTKIKYSNPFFSFLADIFYLWKSLNWSGNPFFIF